MSVHISAEQFETVAAKRVEIESYAGPKRTFDLPVRLHTMTAAIYIVYLAIMSAAFGGGENTIPLVICVLTVAAAFIVPGLWANMGGGLKGKALSWDRFSIDGVETLTGRCKASDATVQVLILPVLILFWGIILAIYGSILLH